MSIFDDNFETGTILTSENPAGKWQNEYAGTGCSITIDSTVKHGGSYSAKSITTTNGYASCNENFTGQNNLYLRAYYRLTAMPPSDSNFTCFNELYKDSATYSASAIIKNISGQLYWGILLQENGTWTWLYESSPSNPLINTWYCVEIRRDVASGIVELWVDGNLKVNQSVSISQASNGIFPGTGNSAGFATTLYIDDLVLSSSYIGPIITTYNLTISAPSPSNGGSTNPSTGTYSINAGTYQSVTATANSGYTFDHWLLDSSNIGSTNPYSVQMNGDHTLQAVFVTSSDQTVTGDLTVDANASINNNLIINGILTVEAPQGYYIDIQGLSGQAGPILQVKQTLLGPDIEAYGFLGSTSDPAKGTGGGAILMGHGFTSPTDNPEITLTDTIPRAQGSTNASGTLIIHNGVITGVTISNPGVDYKTSNATVVSSTGSGAQLLPVIRLNGSIQSITVVNGGQNYVVTDTVNITGDGSNAAAAIHLSDGVITGVNITNNGSGYSFADIDVHKPTSGLNARFAPVIDYDTSAITNINVFSGGYGYSTSDTLDISCNPHNTLYLQQTINAQKDTSPAHLDLGNLTVHGNLTVDGGANFSQDFLAELFAAASAGTALSSGISNIIDQSVLQIINNVLGIKPTAAPTLSTLTLTGSLIEAGSFSQTGGLSINSGGDIKFYANNSPNNCQFKVASNGTNAFNPVWDITGNKSVLYVQRNPDGTDLLQTGSTILNDGYGNMTGVQNLYANAYTINGSHWGNLYGNTVTGNPAYNGTAYVWELAGTGLIIDGCLNVNNISMNDGTLVLDNHGTGNGILQYGTGNYQGMRLAQTINGYDQTHPSVLSLQTYTDAGHSGTFTWQLGALNLSLLFVDHINSASGGGIYCFDHLKIFNGTSNSIKLYDSTNQPGSDGQVLKNVGGYPQWATIQQGGTYTGQAPISVNGSVISLAQANNSTNGYLSSGDWNTFNSKYGSGSSPTFAQLTLGTTGIAIGSGSIYWQESRGVLESDQNWIIGGNLNVGGGSSGNQTNGMSVNGAIGATGIISAYGFANLSPSMNDVTSSRGGNGIGGTWWQNTSGKTLYVMVRFQGASGGMLGGEFRLSPTNGGSYSSQYSQIATNAAAGYAHVSTLHGFVPPNWWYYVGVGANGNVNQWYEGSLF